MTASPIIAGNWKMHGLEPSLAPARAIGRAAASCEALTRVVLCPPFTLLERMKRTLRRYPIALGAQDCSHQLSGAFTGEVSPAMLADAGAKLVILGHSERRSSHRETDERVAAKARAACQAEIEPIICVGESQQARAGRSALTIVGRQVAGSIPEALAGRPLIVAYEPIWAIGTGLAPNTDQIVEMADHIRHCLVQRLGSWGERVPVLYGGSVTATNALEILRLPEIDGALVGGASLNPKTFIPIIEAANQVARKAPFGRANAAYPNL